jgi:hypothetical protein
VTVWGALRSLGAVFAGFLAIVVLVLASAPLTARLLPASAAPPAAPRPPIAYLTVNLVCGFLCAAAGGWITGHLAASHALWHAAGLATLVLGLGVTTAAQGGAARAGQPSWYVWTLPFVGAGGVLLGGWV